MTLIDGAMNQIRQWTVCKPSIDQLANWVAADLLRHLNPGEREEVCRVIAERYPELAEAIRADYPHRWSEAI